MIERHGLCKTRTYTCWSNMKARCHNSNNPNYKYYGAKIEANDAWLKEQEGKLEDVRKKHRRRPGLLGPPTEATSNALIEDWMKEPKQ